MDIIRYYLLPNSTALELCDPENFWSVTYWGALSVTVIAIGNEFNPRWGQLHFHFMLYLWKSHESICHAPPQALGI